MPVVAVSLGIILLGVFLARPLENRPVKEATQVPYKAEVKQDPPALPPADLSVPQQVPVIHETSKAEQQAPVIHETSTAEQQVPVIHETSKAERQVPESAPSKQVESTHGNNGPSLPEKQPLRVEPAEKIADVPEQKPLLVTAPSGLWKEKRALERIASKGDNVSQILMETYGYCDPDLIQLFKEANPQIQNLNKIMIGEQLKLPQLAPPKSGSR